MGTAGAGGSLDPHVEKLVGQRLESILSEQRAARDDERIQRLDSALSLLETELELTDME